MGVRGDKYVIIKAGGSDFSIETVSDREALKHWLERPGNGTGPFVHLFKAADFYTEVAEAEVKS